MSNFLLTTDDIIRPNIYVRLKRNFRYMTFDKARTSAGNIRSLSKISHINLRMLCYYKSGGRSIPLSRLYKIISLTQEKLIYKGLENNLLRIRYGKSGKSILYPRIPLKLSDSLIRIIAHVIGDGGIKNDNIVHYTGNCIYLLDEFRNDIIDVIGYTKCGEYLHRRKEDKTIWFSAIVGILIKNFFKDAGQNFKNIPKLILSSDKKSKSLFLRSLFDDESHVSVSAKTIMFKMANISVVKIVKFMLEDFDIKVGKIGKTRGSEHENFRYYFYISNKANLDKFNSLIGFTDPEKKLKLISLIQGYVRK